MTITKQPEALELAEALRHQVNYGSYDWERVEPMMLKAADKLSRLHTLNAQMMEALTRMCRSRGSRNPVPNEDAYNLAYAAINAAQEQA